VRLCNAASGRPGIVHGRFTIPPGREAPDPYPGRFPVERHPPPLICANNMFGWWHFPAAPGFTTDRCRSSGAQMLLDVHQLCERPKPQVPFRLDADRVSGLQRTHGSLGGRPSSKGRMARE
jgi:hypothetical protein